MFTPQLTQGSMNSQRPFFWLWLVRSHIRFCETDEPKSSFRIGCCATEPGGLGPAQRRILPMRRTEEAESG